MTVTRYVIMQYIKKRNLCPRNVHACRYHEAVATFDQAIHLAPKTVMAFVNKGEALRVMGKWDEAIRCTK